MTCTLFRQKWSFTVSLLKPLLAECDQDDRKSASRDEQCLNRRRIRQGIIQLDNSPIDTVVGELGG